MIPVATEAAGYRNAKVDVATGTETASMTGAASPARVRVTTSVLPGSVTPITGTGTVPPIAGMRVLSIGYETVVTGVIVSTTKLTGRSGATFATGKATSSALTVRVTLPWGSVTGTIHVPSAPNGIADARVVGVPPSTWATRVTVPVTELGTVPVTEMRRESSTVLQLPRARLKMVPIMTVGDAGCSDPTPSPRIARRCASMHVTAWIAVGAMTGGVDRRVMRRTSRF